MSLQYPYTSNKINSWHQLLASNKHWDGDNCYIAASLVRGITISVKMRPKSTAANSLQKSYSLVG